MHRNKQIEKELTFFNSVYEGEFTVGLIDDSNIFEWEATIPGPKNSPYEGGIFTLRIEFPKDYPNYRFPPKVNFMNKVYHPSVRNSDGKISVSILYEDYYTDVKVIDILNAIQNLLINPPCPKNILDMEIYRQYNSDREAFNAKAREWTKKYAYDF